MSNSTSDQNFQKDVVNHKGYVLVDFWAEWCNPCRQLSPIVDEISNDMEGKLGVYKLNIDESPETPAKYNVRGIPTLIIFKDGKPVATKVGSLPKSSLVKWIEESMAS